MSILAVENDELTMIDFSCKSFPSYEETVMEGYAWKTLDVKRKEIVLLEGRVSVDSEMDGTMAMMIESLVSDADYAVFMSRNKTSEIVSEECIRQGKRIYDIRDIITTFSRRRSEEAPQPSLFYRTKQLIDGKWLVLGYELDKIRTFDSAFSSKHFAKSRCEHLNSIYDQTIPSDAEINVSPVGAK